MDVGLRFATRDEVDEREVEKKTSRKDIYRGGRRELYSERSPAGRMPFTESSEFQFSVVLASDGSK